MPSTQINRILEDIIEQKIESVKKRKNRLPVNELKKLIKEIMPPRDFRAAISKPGRLNIIAEIKKASPSAGVIRHDFNPIALSSQIESAGAAAISVLTEEKYFHGDLFHLVNVRENVAIPVMRKDFIIDEYQVYESRAYNADALLLIARILEKNRLSEMLAVCAETGIHALVEIHDQADAENALSAGASLIGINNRDLAAFSVDINNTLKLIKEIPRDKVIVSESGIKTREDAMKLKSAGVNAILVGESLMSSSNINEKIRELSV